MRKIILLTITFSILAAAQDRTRNHHLLGVSKPLTPPSAGAPRDIADNFLHAQAAALGVSGADLSSAYVVRQYTDAHNGVTHILYRQQFQGLDVYNSGFVVNLDADGRVLNAGGDLYPAPQTAAPERISSLAAVRAAVKSVNPKAAARYVPFQSQAAPRRAGAIRFTAGELPEDPEGRAIWFGARGVLVPAWQVFVTAEDGVTRYSVIADVNQHVLARRKMTYFQSAPTTPRGLVFERESPQPNPNPGTLLMAAPALADRTLQSFAGDPSASPKGWVANNETAGNNVIVGENRLGAFPFGYTTPFPPVVTTKAPGGDFSFPLQLGPGVPGLLTYADAINTNLFYWTNRAHDLHYAAGFTEAAGNFQADNLGKGGVQGDALYAFSHFGAAQAGYAEAENSFYTSVDDTDGSQSILAMFVSDSGVGGIMTDGSLDSAVIIHEYTHGVSSRLMPRGYDTFQVAAMGEAWSDFYALEFLAPEGAPTDGVYPVSQYFFQSWGQDSVRTRPYSTNMDVNPLTFADLGKVIPFQEVHADGEVWFEVLWEARAALIKQLGEKEGRRRIRTLVLDGMKLAPLNSSMVDMRDAILLADRTDYKGASQDQLWAAFAKRGLGALAWADNPNTTHVLASFVTPTNKGQIAIFDSPVSFGDYVKVVVSDLNYAGSTLPVQLTSTAGDVESLSLRRQGSVFVGNLPTSSNIVNRENGTLNVTPGDAIGAFYTDYDSPGGAVQVYAFAPTQNPYYAVAASAPTYSFDSSNERLLSTASFAAKVDLPWDFPFFGRKYRTMFVHDNGLISFGATTVLDDLTFGCTDSNALSQVAGIAPLWFGMTTQGAAQPGEGVYVTRNIVDSVTVRWAGETVSPFGLDGNPVNFAATISYDGKISFQYGKGNAELGSAYNPYYCGPGLTAGISPGHDLYTFETELPTYNNLAVRFDPPFGTNTIPQGVLETPKANDTVKDSLNVSGIAYDAQATVYSVDILIDGVKMAKTRPSVSRTDFCGQQKVNGCPTVGFNLNVNVSTLAPGSHGVQVRVTNTRGGSAVYPDQPVAFTTQAGQASLPTGAIESPTEGQVVKGAVTVKGYASSATLRVSSVDTLIDGISYGPTSYGIRRTDICGTLTPTPPNCPSIGFQFTLDTANELPPITDGSHTIQIRVRDELGRYTLIPDTPVNFKVNNGAAPTVSGAFTSIKPGAKISGTVDLTGYVYGVGTTVSRAVLYVDQMYNYGTVAYGQPAPDVCASLTGVAACPNIGFTYSFDTRRLDNGPHTLSIGAVTPAGVFLIPGVGSPVMSVVVNNQ
ncbi:MAG: M36 family metallopeptidase [Acidobacteria bacterium]|nr:M36 family metallopeptidase [Acidobacteriota bacterium]